MEPKSDIIGRDFQTGRSNGMRSPDMKLTRRSILRASAFAAALPALSRVPLSSAALAQGAPDGTWRHGLSLFGDIKYPADFKHFEYVNPQAPQGGMVRRVAI